MVIETCNGGYSAPCTASNNASASVMLMFTTWILLYVDNMLVLAPTQDKVN